MSRSPLLAGAAFLTLVAFAGTSHAADAAKPDCFSSVSTWFDASAADCPLSAYGLTFYGTIDAGGGYETHGAPLNGDAKTGVGELISKINDRGLWEGVPNGMSQSNFGVKYRGEIVPGWFLIGDLNAGFDPLSTQFANGPQSLVDNNNIALAKQNYNTDSARSTGFDNTRAYVGISNKTFANGFIADNNTAFTSGARFAF